MTFVATALAAYNEGYSLRVTDVDLHGRAVFDVNEESSLPVPVHLYGLQWKGNFSPEIIDGAQAIGLPDLGAPIVPLSFYPSKALGAYGDAGVLLTSYKEVAEYARSVRDYGRLPGDKFLSHNIGMNERLSAFQAAVLTEKLPFLPDELARRRTVAIAYWAAFEGQEDTIRCVVPSIEQLSFSPYVFPIELKTEALRDSLQAFLTSNDIQSGLYYPCTILDHPSIVKVLLSEVPPAEPILKRVMTTIIPNSKGLADRTLCLPMHGYITRKELAYVIDTVHQWLELPGNLKGSKS